MLDGQISLYSYCPYRCVSKVWKHNGMDSMDINIPYVAKLFNKRNDFGWGVGGGGGVNEHKKCILIFFASFVLNISYCKKH
jgi:hypothetical protein